MSDNSDRSDFEKSGSESDSSDSEYSSAFTTEEDESETETPVADSPEEDKKTRPSVNVIIGNFKNVPPLADVLAARKALKRPFAKKQREVQRYNEDLKQRVFETEKLRNRLTAALTALLTLNDQERFFYEIVGLGDICSPPEPDLKFLLKVPSRDTEKSVKSIDKAFAVVESCHKSLEDAKVERCRMLMTFIRKVMPEVGQVLDDLGRKYPERLQPILDLCPPDTIPEVVSDEEVIKLINELNLQFQNDLAKFRQLQEKYPKFRFKDEKNLDSMREMIEGYKRLIKRLSDVSKEFLDPAKFKDYVRHKNPKEEFFCDEEKHKAFKKQQKFKDKKLDLQEYIDDSFMDVSVMEKKIFRIKALVEKYRKEQLILNKGVDEQGNQIVKIPQEYLDRLKDEIIGTQRHTKELEEELRRVKDQGSELEKERQRLEAELTGIREDGNDTAEASINDASISQTALDIKILRREYTRMGELEKAYSETSKELEQHMALEEKEFESRVEQILADQKEELNLLQQKNAELTRELEALPPFPDSVEVFNETVTKHVENGEKLKTEMNKHIEKSEKQEVELEQLEELLDECTADYEDHIRIDFHEPLLKDIRKNYTDVNEDASDFLVDQANTRAEEHLENLMYTPEEEREQHMEDINVQNERLYMEVTKMNETLMFLDEANPDDKRKFYTSEADRRVRFTRHQLERLRELDNLAMKAIKCHQASEEKLGSRYEDVQTWVTNIEKQQKMQEEKNSRMFADFLNEVPTMKKQAQERKETMMDVDKKLDELGQVEEQIRKMDGEEDEMEKLFGECSEEVLEELQFANVELQLEIDEAVAKGIELDLLIEKEEERLRELEAKMAVRADAQRKMEKRLKHAENKLAEAKNKQEEREKIEKYGSYEKMLQAETQRLKELTTCSNCLTRDKSGIITKCCHVFCIQCIEDLVRARNRKCPKCKLGFGANDFRKIYLGEG